MTERGQGDDKMSIFQEIESITNLWEKGKKYFSEKAIRRKYKEFPYYFKTYNKKTYINSNGDGIVFLSCKLVVLDKSKCKFIRAKLDISDAQDHVKFPSFSEMKKTKDKIPFRDFIFKIQHGKDIVTSVKENYNILSTSQRSQYEDSNRHICLKINLNANMLEENKEYQISYMFSVPGMFPIKDGYYDIKKSVNHKKQEMVSSLDIEQYCENCKFSIYLSSDICLDDMISGYVDRSGVHESSPQAANCEYFGFYCKNTMCVPNANKYQSVSFTWNVCLNPSEQNGGVENGKIVSLLTYS